MGKKEYICPNCNQKQTVVVERQYVLYSYDLEKEAWKGEGDEGGERWECPECERELPNELVEGLSIF